MSNQTNTEINLHPGNTVRVNAHGDTGSNGGFSSTNINAYLLDLRIAVMLTISTVWKKDQDEQPEGFSDLKWCERAHAILVELRRINALTGHIPEPDALTLPEVHRLFQIALKRISENQKISQDFVESKKGYLFRAMVELCEPNNLKLLWTILFRFEKDHYPHFGVQIIKPTAHWNSYGDNQWTKPDTEALYMSLPGVVPDNLAPIAFDMHKYNLEDGYNCSVVLSNGDTDYAKAYIMTKFYESFPSFLGEARLVSKRKNDNDSPEYFMSLYTDDEFPSRNSTLRMEDQVFDTSRVDPSGNNYDLGLASDQYEGFSSMMSKLLTVVWNNDSVRKRFDYGQRLMNESDLLKGHKNYKPVYAKDEECNDGKPKVIGYRCDFGSIFDLSFYLNELSRGEKAGDLEKFNREYTQELNAILKRYFHYEMPWVFNLRLIFPSKEVFFQKVQIEVEKDGETAPQDFYGYYPMENQVLNLTTIEVPHAPSNNETNNVSLALARYNATGPAYPFTCS